MSRASLPPLRNDLIYPQSRNELQINSRSTGPSPVHLSDRTRDRNRNVSPLGFPGAAGSLLDSPMSLPGPYFGSSEQSSSRMHQSRFQDVGQQQSQPGGSRAPSARSSSADRYGYSERGGFRDYREADVERAFDPRDDPSRYSSGRQPQQPPARVRDMQMNSGFGGSDPYGYEGDRSSGRYPAQPQPPVSSQNGNGNYNKFRSRSFDEYNPNAAPQNVPQQVAQYSSYQNPGGPLNQPLNPPVHQPTYLGSASYTSNMPPPQLPGGGPPPPIPLAGQSVGFSGSAPSVAHLNQPLQPGCGQPPPGGQFGPAGAANMSPFGLTQQGDAMLGEPAVQFLAGGSRPLSQQFGLGAMPRYGPGPPLAGPLGLVTQSSIEATMLEYQAEIANLHGYRSCTLH